MWYIKEERATGFEPATATLATWGSTTELRPLERHNSIILSAEFQFSSFHRIFFVRSRFPSGGVQPERRVDFSRTIEKQGSVGIPAQFFEHGKEVGKFVPVGGLDPFVSNRSEGGYGGSVFVQPV